MKPIKLKLTAFGSFAGAEEVDFEALAPRGLFVVAGDTGTGKTTIFDAMCWALYGKMPLKEPDSVRSHHVTDGVRTEVEFTFECDGERYVVTRNPEQLKPSKRGSGYVNEDAFATLERLSDGTTESVATKVTDVNNACQTLVGLDAEQFQRVILLPQGEFSEFLLANSKDREALLETLFGGEVYDHIVTKLNDQRKTLESDLGRIEAKINAKLDDARDRLRQSFETLGLDMPDDLTTADHERLRQLAEQAVDPISVLSNREQDLDSATSKAIAALAMGTEAKGRFESWVKHREALEKLNAAFKIINPRRDAALASAMARPVAEAENQLEMAKCAFEEAQRARDELLGAIVKEFGALDMTVDQLDLPTITNRLEAAKKLNEQQVQHLDDLDRATQAVSEATRDEEQVTLKIEGLERETERIQQQLNEVDHNLESLRPTAVDPAGIKEDLVATEALISTRSKMDALTFKVTESTKRAEAAAKRHEAVWNDFIATEAPRLAEHLTDGSPCPVCGSTKHPAPAISQNRATTFAMVEEARKKSEETKSEEEGFQRKLAGLEATLGKDLDTSLEELHTRADRLREDHKTATRAVNDLSQLEDRHNVLSDEIQSLEKDTAAAMATAKASAKTAKDAESALRAATVAVAGIDRAETDRARSIIGRLEDTIAPLDEHKTAATNALGQLSSAQRHLDKALSATPFANIGEARALVIAQADEEAALEAAEDHKRRTSEVTSALNELEKLGIPEKCPDIEALQRDRDAAEHLHKEAHQMLVSAENAWKSAEEALDQHDSLVKGSNSLRSNFETVRYAHTVCNGRGSGMPIPLKRWVLARELDRVTSAANIHLGRMTNGRYGLRRPEEHADRRKSTGLDLEVTDSNTGRPRSARSLSGGEQFQASLALALGLKDVVSQGGTASGKRFEALFIDEGFGSLSTESLDDAIRTLEHLQAAGHMVGAITHVDAMKQNLHVGIEVKHREDGMGSTITVHP